jgi:CHASE1-domain containing sensor protein/nitrogen-specific signal transduction histidine kinase
MNSEVIPSDPKWSSIFAHTPYAIVVTALLYFVAGKLALLLAIPPGYATAIWPAAGLALALLYLNGKRLWPGVWLGSFLVNLNFSTLFSLPCIDFLLTLRIPLIIGLGASFQALAGAYLLERKVGYPLELDTTRSVWRFIVFACGLSSLISASIGCLTLWFMGVLAPENLLFSWFTWWVGDGLGVMIFATLVFVFYAKPRDVWHSRRRILPIVLLGVSLIIVTLFVFASRWELARQHDEFDRYSDDLFQRSQSLLDAQLANLYAVKGLFESSDNVTNEEFRIFVSSIMARNPGFQAVTWTLRIRRDERAKVEAQMSQEAGRDIKLTRRDPNGQMVLQREQSNYVLIRYIEPLARNTAALGYDISSATLPRQALLRATISGQPAVTDLIRLVQEQDNQQGVVIYVPVFSPLSDTRNGSMLKGYVSGVFRINDLMAVLLPSAQLQRVSVSVYGEGSEPFYQHVSDKVTGEDAVFTVSRNFQLADKTWRFEVSGSQAFLAGTRSLVPWGMLATGLLFSGLLGMTFLVLTGQNYRSEIARLDLKQTVSRLKETQTHLVEAEKMASMGGLVAGFAHELNTPLGIVITAHSTMQTDLQRLSEMLNANADKTKIASVIARMEEASRIVLANIQRAGGLVTSFKQVSVDQATAETREINLYEYLSDILIHLSPDCSRSGHSVELVCPKHLSIRTVPGGLAQVVINLLNNSLLHAFVKAEQGSIVLTVVKNESGIVLNFSDNGVGIAAESLGKVFDPFFTTRRGLGATGLGLHLVYNIVTQQLQGRIKVKSKLGEGTSFEIVLPAEINKFAGTAPS